MKISTGGGGDFPVLEEDAYLARIYSFVHIGIQDTPYGLKDQAIVTWEIPSEIVDE